jgi:hypothetical protein
MMNGRSFALVALTVFGSIGCAPATGDDVVESVNAISSAGDFTITLAATAPSTVNLGEKVELDVTVTPANGFTGNVDLGVTGISPGVTVAPVSVTLTKGPAQAKLILSADLTADVTPKDTVVPIKVVATSGSEQASASASFKVMPNVTIYIPSNIRSLYNAPGGPLRAEWGDAFGPNNKPLRTQANNPIVITIFNNDTVQHIIHGPGGSFPHGDFSNPIQPNAFEMKNGAPRTRTMNVGDSATAYIHGEPNSQNAEFKITIAATQ